MRIGYPNRDRKEKSIKRFGKEYRLGSIIINNVQRMPEALSVKVFLGKPYGRRGRGRHLNRWLDDLERDVETKGIRN